MRLLCDVHISYRVVKFLKSHAHEVVHVNETLEKWYTRDKAICDYADQHDYIVLSKDKDFRNSHFVCRTPKKLILITLGNVSNEDMVKSWMRAAELIEEENKKPFFLIELSGDYIAFS